MKQNVPMPLAVVVAVVVLGVVGFFLWRHFMEPPSSDEKPVSPSSMIKPGMKLPTNREEGMKMFRGGH